MSVDPPTLVAHCDGPDRHELAVFPRGIKPAVCLVCAAPVRGPWMPWAKVPLRAKVSA